MAGTGNEYPAPHAPAPQWRRHLLRVLLFALCCHGSQALAQACGKEGQSACAFWVRIPSCDPYLVEAGGRCVHPPCGREGQRACTVVERLPSCDLNLAEVGGRCVQPTPCGDEGQRACPVWERVPSCNAGLVEAGGRCVHPPCGREGEAACTVVQRVPSCDAGLIERNGRCGLPTPCGGESQRACRVWERLPSCNADLVEAGGRCLHPPCGREGEAACTVVQRVPSCDAGLVERNGRCGLPTSCGAEGQRACPIWERLPSCDAYLVETGGRCMHPPCGREGEAACTVLQRLPSCDRGLVENNGRCGLPTPCGAEGQRACWVWERLPSCNVDLLERGGSCVHPPCGRSGERACTLAERPAGCDAGLAALRGGRCAKPDPGCGGALQPQCRLDQRLQPCDTGTVAVSGLCVARTPCGGAGQRACTLDERVLFAGTLRGRACLLPLTEIPGCSSGWCLGSNSMCADLSAPMPEPEIGWSPGRERRDPMRGYADVHVHMFSHLGFGGGVMAGTPYAAQGGAAQALKADYATDADLVSFLGTALPPAACPPTQPRCGKVVLHGDHLPIDDTAGLGTGDSATSNFGAPLFNGWPTWKSTTHQQVYYRWLERAWRGGMRLMVMLAVNNEVLCSTSKRLRTADCADGMQGIDAQLREAYAFQRWLDAQPGGGWFRIVTSADQADAVIRDGKLAVVLGIETDSLFNCKALVPCDPAMLRERVAYYRKTFGVRHIFPVHNFDNGLAGTAVWMDILNIGNRFIEQQWYAVEECDISDFRLSTDLLSISGNTLLGRLKDHSNVPYPLYPGRPSCNAKGLSDNGKALLGALMDSGTMIDIDHMSARAIDDTLALARARGGYPLVAGHGQFNELYAAQGSERHERRRTRAQLEAIRDMGGLVSVMTVDDLKEGGSIARADGSVYVNDCVHSSKSFAQNYLYAVSVMRGPVAFGSDFNGMAGHVGPRLGEWGCDRKDGQWAAQQRQAPLRYPFALPGFGSFAQQVSGQRRFDFNLDGLAHIGLLPDLIADMQTTGITAQELDPLFRSAQAYTQAWRRAERQATQP